MCALTDSYVRWSAAFAAHGYTLVPDGFDSRGNPKYKLRNKK